MAAKQYKVDQETFTEMYMSDTPSDVIAKHFKISIDYIYALAKRYKLPRRILVGKPVPDGFAEDAPNMTYNALKRKYGAHPYTLSRWAKLCGVVIGINPNKVRTYERPPLPADFEEMVKLLPFQGDMSLGKHYGVTRSVVEHWITLIGISRADIIGERMRRAKNKVMVPGAIVSQAAHFLRKFHRNVHSTDIPMREFCDKSLPNTWWFFKGLPPETSGKYYVSGEGIVDVEWIIKEAKRKGWRSDYIGG